MYGVTFNDNLKVMRKTCHGYEQEFGDIQGLSGKQFFP